MTRMTPLFSTLALAAGLALANAGAAAQMQMPMPDRHDAAPAAAQAAPAALSEGEVRKVDKDAGKLTIKHGPLENLGMPGMTMVFKAQDPAMLEQVKAGDRIHFRAERVNGALTVTRLEPAN